MTQIMSREEFERWLKDKPINWLQVLTVRAGLRALPFDFPSRSYSQTIENETLSLFRVFCISWIACNFSEYDTAFAAASAARSANNKSSEFNKMQLRVSTIAMLSGESHYKAQSGKNFKPDLSYEGSLYIFQSYFDGANLTDVYWKNCQEDCYRLISYKNPLIAGHKITRKKLWPLGYDKNWKYSWWRIAGNLTDLDPTYQVWIDWYNRRIKGHDAAFDIPGDNDRVHDKAILARLVDATDEDFWSKGATYVNTTLQGWIDEARQTAEFESIVCKLEAGAATHFGSPQEREARSGLRTKLDTALPPAHAPIGHNHPPEDIDPAETPILLPVIREEASAMLVTLDQPAPDVLAVAKTLSRWSKIKSTYQHDEFSKDFSSELGTSAARGIVVVLTTLCLLGLAWLKTVLRI